MAMDAVKTTTLEEQKEIKLAALIKRFARVPLPCFVCGYIIHKETHWQDGTRFIHKACLGNYTKEEK